MRTVVLLVSSANRSSQRIINYTPMINERLGQIFIHTKFPRPSLGSILQPTSIGRVLYRLRYPTLQQMISVSYAVADMVIQESEQPVECELTGKRAAAANSSRWDYTINGAQLFTRAARAYFHPRTIPLMWQPHFPGCLLCGCRLIGFQSTASSHSIHTA